MRITVRRFSMLAAAPAGRVRTAKRSQNVSGVAVLINLTTWSLVSLEARIVEREGRRQERGLKLCGTGLTNHVGGGQRRMEHWVFWGSRPY
jgi:hypothetical protein